MCESVSDTAIVVPIRLSTVLCFGRLQPDVSGRGY